MARHSTCPAWTAEVDGKPPVPGGGEGGGRKVRGTVAQQIRTGDSQGCDYCSVSSKDQKGTGVPKWAVSPCAEEM